MIVIARLGAHVPRPCCPLTRGCARWRVAPVAGCAQTWSADPLAAGAEATWEPASEDDCFLCGRGPTATNPVMFGNMTDLRESWAGVTEAYARLAPVMMCAPSAPNHTHCRTFLRTVMQQLQQLAAAPGAGGKAGSGGAGSSTGSVEPCGPSDAGHAHHVSHGSSGSVGSAAAAAAAEDKLDAMARCYPLGQLTRFLDAHDTKKSHRRCRGGLLSMFRTLEQVAAHEKELPILAQVSEGCGYVGWIRSAFCVLRRTRAWVLVGLSALGCGCECGC
jgi:hypothetical protein